MSPCAHVEMIGERWDWTSNHGVIMFEPVLCQGMPKFRPSESNSHNSHNCHNCQVSHLVLVTKEGLGRDQTCPWWTAQCSDMFWWKIISWFCSEICWASRPGLKQFAVMAEPFFFLGVTMNDRTISHLQVFSGSAILNHRKSMEIPGWNMIFPWFFHLFPMEKSQKLQQLRPQTAPGHRRRASSKVKRTLQSLESEGGSSKSLVGDGKSSGNMMRI